MLTAKVTDDIHLGPLEPWHAPQLSRFVDANRGFLETWLPWPAEIVDEASARAVLQWRAEAHARDEYHFLGLWDGAELAGGVAFPVFNVDRSLCELGVWLGQNYTGQGIVSAACGVAINWAIDERGMNRVEWRCIPQNTASSAVARRLGMTLEGTLRQAFRLGDDLHDVEVWALLAPEWRATAPSR